MRSSMSSQIQPRVGDQQKPKGKSRGPKCFWRDLRGESGGGGGGNDASCGNRAPGPSRTLSVPISDAVLALSPAAYAFFNASKVFCAEARSAMMKIWFFCDATFAFFSSLFRVCLVAPTTHTQEKACAVVDGQR
jgi:hypothetical protein